MTPPPPGGWFDAGATAEVNAAPAGGYLFTGWSGDVTGSANPEHLVMSGPATAVSHFVANDVRPPSLTACYPAPSSVSVPRNTEIQIGLVDGEGGTGVDGAGIDVSVNGGTIVSGGADQTGGRASVTARGRGFAIRYIPEADFSEGGTVTVRVRCRDRALPANALDSVYSFSVGTSRTTILARQPVGPAGGTVDGDDTGVLIFIPAGALDDTAEITVGRLDRPPQIPDTLRGMGIVFHFGPEGLVFDDSVVVAVPYGRSDLDSAGTSNPLDLPVFYFSTRTGEWTRLTVFQATRDRVYVRVAGFCCLGIGRLDTKPDAVDPDRAAADSPVSFEVSRNYPNPFNPVTAIRYRIPGTGRVTVAVLDGRGRKVRTLVDAVQGEGVHEAVWDGRSDGGEAAGSGVYVFSVRTGGHVRFVKAALVK